jgi:hypothetical protein
MAILNWANPSRGPTMSDVKAAFYDHILQNLPHLESIKIHVRGEQYDSLVGDWVSFPHDSEREWQKKVIIRDVLKGVGLKCRVADIVIDSKEGKISARCKGTNSDKGVRISLLKAPKKRQQRERSRTKKIFTRFNIISALLTIIFLLFSRLSRMGIF